MVRHCGPSSLMRLTKAKSALSERTMYRAMASNTSLPVAADTPRATKRNTSSRLLRELMSVEIPQMALTRPSLSKSGNLFDK
ncbi:hypothetical protein D3C84_247390 [compost metagenome]